jgi:hypothetical protein
VRSGSSDEDYIPFFIWHNTSQQQSQQEQVQDQQELQQLTLSGQTKNKTCSEMVCLPK